MFLGTELGHFLGTLLSQRSNLQGEDPDAASLGGPSRPLAQRVEGMEFACRARLRLGVHKFASLCHCLN
jgi:hypothetical protein